jgi:excisionase family DNA binding protein
MDSTIEKNKKVLTATEAGKKYRVQPETIIRLLKAGKVHGFRIGNLWRIYESSLEGYIRSTSTKPEASEISDE